MAARAAADLDADGARREVEVVVDEDQVLGAVAGERGAGEVHERRGLEQGDVLRADGDVGRLGLLLAAPGAAVALRKLLDNEVAGVVAGALVGAAGVAEADDYGGP